MKHFMKKTQPFVGMAVAWIVALLFLFCPVIHITAHPQERLSAHVEAFAERGKVNAADAEAYDAMVADWLQAVEKAGEPAFTRTEEEEEAIQNKWLSLLAEGEKERNMLSGLVEQLTALHESLVKLRKSAVADPSAEKKEKKLVREILDTSEKILELLAEADVSPAVAFAKENRIPLAGIEVEYTLFDLLTNLPGEANAFKVLIKTSKLNYERERLSELNKEQPDDLSSSRWLIWKADVDKCTENIAVLTRDLNDGDNYTGVNRKTLNFLFMLDEMTNHWIVDGFLQPSFRLVPLESPDVDFIYPSEGMALLIHSLMYDTSFTGLREKEAQGVESTMAVLSVLNLIAYLVGAVISVYLLIATPVGLLKNRKDGQALREFATGRLLLSWGVALIPVFGLSLHGTALSAAAVISLILCGAATVYTVIPGLWEDLCKGNKKFLLPSFLFYACQAVLFLAFFLLAGSGDIYSAVEHNLLISYLLAGWNYGRIACGALLWGMRLTALFTGMILTHGSIGSCLTLTSDFSPLEDRREVQEEANKLSDFLKLAGQAVLAGILMGVFGLRLSAYGTAAFILLCVAVLGRAVYWVVSGKTTPAPRASVQEAGSTEASLSVMDEK